MVGGGSQRLLSLNPTTVMVVLLLGLWLLLGCDNNYLVKNLLYVVKDDLVSQTELFAKKIQMKILKRRRMKLNVFCNTKCHNNKIIMNFTDVEAGVDFLAFLPINIGERYKKIFDLRKVISQSEIPFDLKQLHQLSVGL